MSALPLNGLQSLDGAARLALRLFIGAFLVWGVWDNITDPAQMAEFEHFLRSIRCPLPALAAPVSVWTQFISGVLILAGFLTRWAGLLLAINFVVAMVLLGSLGQDFRQLFPPAVLIFIGALLATGGAGPFSIDRLLSRRGAA